MKKNLDLDYEISSEVPQYLVGDPLRLRQILLNLIGNALKFTEKGRIDLNVSVDFESSQQSFKLLFSVKDTGIGISKEDQVRLFQDFEQAQTGTTRKYGGTGLGLSICHKLIHLMGGKIWLDSKPERGTTFFFKLNFQEGFQPESSELQNVDIAGESSDLFKKKILIAEDNLINQKLIHALLKKAGFINLTFVGNGQLAVEEAAKGNYEVILMDVQMPIMDGLEATRLIREKHDQSKKIKIIGLSANILDSDRAKGIEAGMDDYLGKPIDQDALKGALAKAS
jgi:CheY-like chemotaxis protein